MEFGCIMAAPELDSLGLGGLYVKSKFFEIKN